MIIQNTNSAIQPIQSGIGISSATPVNIPSSPTPATQQPSSHQLKTAVDSINRGMSLASSSLQFSVDASTKQAVVRVVDTDTGQLIVQIPSKVALAIAQSIDQQQQGQLLSQKA